MKINAINSQNFGLKKFRLPQRIVKPSTESSLADQYVPKESLIAGVFVQEYNNPKAEEYFYKAMEENDIDKKLHYLELMGDYKIIDISLEQKIDNFTKSKMP